MAIIRELRLEVSIFCNGKRTREYLGPEGPRVQDHDFTYQCDRYIEIEDGAEFSIWVANHDFSPHTELWAENNLITVWPFIDGMKAEGANLDCQTGSYREIEGVRTFSEDSAAATLRRFRFAAVQTTDEASNDQVERDAKVARQLGMIQVKVFRTTGGYQATTVRQKKYQLSSGDIQLSEKSLKGRAVSHGTR